MKLYVHLRIALLAILVVLAGCPTASNGGADPTATVTPAPDPTAIEASLWTDAPVGATGTPTINGSALAAAHAHETSQNFTRTARLRIETDTELLLAYRANLTIAETGLVIERRYQGPATARFVPGSTTATSAKEQYYDGDAGTGLRQVVDGRIRTDEYGEYPRFDPALRIYAEGFVETLLDGVPIRNRTEADTYVASTHRVTLPAATVPPYLTAPRNAEIRARIDASGQIERLVVTYEATYDGRPVQVEQTLRWGPATVDDEPPSWVEPTPSPSREP